MHHEKYNRKFDCIFDKPFFRDQHLRNRNDESKTEMTISEFQPCFKPHP